MKNKSINSNNICTIAQSIINTQNSKIYRIYEIAEKQ